ncbi:helix-hairpin-helix domain-containing protein [Telluribacter sp. SYSU D00476]|uniref:ComEA family DNA-binding protein n=1 Tax=Telluribacter sp. SYSU D00476 TaxID=2811430 RepID=UPI001FF31D9E|nr:helix-hairpin-helix domain-containing protein [Telluribacter sp. SYSU D00476]
MLRRILYHIQDFFGISPKEARGALFLIVLSLVLLWAPTIFRHWVLPHLAEPPKAEQRMSLDSIAATLAATPAPASEHEAYTPPSGATPSAKPARLFAFNPNEATPEQLQELGVPAFLARRIDNYRRKGGKFRRKQDLRRIYDFPDDLYQRLEPYIVLDESTPATASANAPAPTERSTAAALPAEIRASSRPTLVPFDINTTDTSQLIKLRGIGSTLSLRIVKFRDALGGFHSATQFSEVYGLDSLALTELHRYARIQTGVQKLNINTATAEDLTRHPYLRNKRQAEVIIRYREQHGPYQSADDLKKVKVLDEKTISKITPYLAF